MNTKEAKNVVASVLARLRNTSKSNGVPFQQVLQQYAMERFLYRVSKSRHAQSVILKGAHYLIPARCWQTGGKGGTRTLDPGIMRTRPGRRRR